MKRIEKNAATFTRRDILRAGASLVATFPIAEQAVAAVSRLAQPVKLGLITDLHQDIMHDAKQRLAAFVAHTRQRNVDGVMQLGDFAYPNPKNQDVIDLFNGAHDTRLHVLGNHDTDSGHTPAQCLAVWGMPDRYYVQSVKGIWVVVLDGNEKGSPTHKGGYPAYIGPEQTAWLKAKLQELKGPIVVVSHQPLVGPLAVDNAVEIQQLLSTAADKVILALNGHTHIDSLIYVGSVPYLTINSASYYWVGEKFSHESYPKDVHQTHKWIASTCPYADPLFTILTIDPATLTLRLEGRQSSWVGASPADLNFGDTYAPLKIDREITPAIRPRTLKPRKG